MSRTPWELAADPCTAHMGSILCELERGHEGPHVGCSRWSDDDIVVTQSYTWTEGEWRVEDAD
jgi:hypothetical protein